MWLWILSALVLTLVWGGWYLLNAGASAATAIPIWVPLAATVGVVLFLVGVYVFRRIRAARAARALEKAIAQQAQEQALAAKPERVAEIQELHRQIQQGIEALKQSKLGSGKRGSDALYELPWYVMVGPPGAGKTTALRHSGLVFPYLDPNGGGVRGVGGTRNCDWWFTNEAILLDTAGRYTTEADDHDEWMAFLEQLLRYRPEKPLNGVVVAVSASELIDAPEEQIKETGRKIRARIDEMQQTLKMVLPVYVLFTKIDLVAGFSEFFGDLKKSERAQPWGATFLLNADKGAPGKLFAGEFDTLVEKLHTRGLRRMALERSRETKEKVYQFPLEFAALKQNLADFMDAAFGPRPALTVTDVEKTDKKARDKKKKVEEPVGPPILRGFYFTSGVQEGRPLDRVIASMARQFGLRGGTSEESPERVESKSFFLRDVFERVIFPDRTLAARTEGEVRRVYLQRVAVAAAAFAVALLLLIPAAVSFSKNQALVGETNRIANEAHGLVWESPDPPLPQKIDKLDNLRKHTELLQQYRDDPDPSYTFFMHQGGKLFEPSKNQYIASLQDGFVRPVKGVIEDRLKLVQGVGDRYLDDFNALKTYLLLGETDHDRLKDQELYQWEAARLTQAWADLLRRSNGDLSEADLKQRLSPHVAYYLDLLRKDEIKPEPLNKAEIDRVRADLQRVDDYQKNYHRFVTVLIDQKYDDNGPSTRENMKYPPVGLNDVFYDRPEVLTKIRSVQKEREGKWFQVRGPFTYKGHQQVLASLNDGAKLLEREKWVVPLSDDEKNQEKNIAKALERVRRDYDDAYIREWVAFFRDLDVEVPTANRDAIKEFTILSTPEWPYQRLLRVLWENTQFDEVEGEDLADNATVDGGVVDQLKQNLERKIQQRTKGIKISLPGAKGERFDPVPERFRTMVRFGEPGPQPKPKDGEPPAPPPNVELNEYVGKLRDLSGEMGNIEDGPINAETKKATDKFEDAVKTTQGLILKLDETGQELLTPLLMNPLRQAYKAVVRHAGGAASGLWEVVVFPTYRDKIKDRYPFNLAATRDASFTDAVNFFKPKDGVLWGFYDQNLKPFHTKQGHDFIPEAHLEVRPRPAKPFTPFNANLYNCLKRADEITDALFAEGGDKPKVEFAVNLKTVSPIVSEVLFELDGQKRLYRNEKEMWTTFTWPGPKPTGARIRVRGAGGLDEEIVREGPWGMFRLMEAATSTAEKDNDQVFVVTWEMTAPPVTVVMEVRPTRANHPFPSSFFRATNCPPSIGDRFGKGKG